MNSIAKLLGLAKVSPTRDLHELANTLVPKKLPIAVATLAQSDTLRNELDGIHERCTTADDRKLVYRQRAVVDALRQRQRIAARMQSASQQQIVDGETAMAAVGRTTAARDDAQQAAATCARSVEASDERLVLLDAQRRAMEAEVESRRAETRAALQAAIAASDTRAEEVACLALAEIDGGPNAWPLDVKALHLRIAAISEQRREREADHQQANAALNVAMAAAFRAEGELAAVAYDGALNVLAVGLYDVLAVKLSAASAGLELLTWLGSMTVTVGSRARVWFAPESGPSASALVDITQRLVELRRALATDLSDLPLLDEPALTATRRLVAVAAAA